MTRVNTTIADASLLKIKSEGKVLVLLGKKPGEIGKEAFAMGSTRLTSVDFQGPVDFQGGRRLVCAPRKWIVVEEPGTAVSVAIKAEGAEEFMWVTPCEEKALRLRAKVRPLPWNIDSVVKRDMQIDPSVKTKDQVRKRRRVS